MRVEDDEAVVALGRRHVQIVAQAEFERQVGSPLDVVLHEETYRVLLDAVHAVVERNGEGVRVASDEGGDRGEVERASVLGEVVVIEEPILPAKLKGVSPALIADGVGDDNSGIATSLRDLRGPPQI